MWTAVLAICLVGGIGVGLGIIIGFIAKQFSVEIDPNIELVGDLLPGANCGGCGFAGCADFAKAVVQDGVAVNACPVASEEIVADIAKAMGVTVEEKEKMVAVILCGGSNSKTKNNTDYNGVNDCLSASLVSNGGGKGCSVGCLGFASCARVCPFDAIEMRDGLAVVHPHLCIGCGACIKTCPKKLIKMVPEKAPVHIFCSSTEKGPAKRKYCSVSCLGCRKCTKVEGEEGTVTMNGFLAEINYDNPPSGNIVDGAKCPTKCISNRHWKKLLNKKKETL